MGTPLSIIIIPAVVVILFMFRRRRTYSAVSHNDTGNSGNSHNENKTLFMPLADAQAVVQQLEQLGYYKYAHPDDIVALKQDLQAGLAEYGVLSTMDNSQTFTPLDYRFYFLDGETLFEEGGFNDALQRMQPLFDKMSFAVSITDHVEGYEMQTRLLNHSITINGKPYTIFKNFEGYGWGEAAQRFAEIINDQLWLQHKDERLYLINGGNDGSAVFLTQPQFALIDRVLKDIHWKPLPVGEWCKVFKVDPTKYRRVL